MAGGRIAERGPQGLEFRPCLDGSDASDQVDQMKSVSVTELKAQLSKYLRVVRRGGEVQVLERGVPIARLCPVRADAEPGDERLVRLERAGILRRGTGDLSWVLESDLPEPRGASVSSALAADREDRLARCRSAPRSC